MSYIYGICETHGSEIKKNNNKRFLNFVIHDRGSFPYNTLICSS